jgi:sulfite exporter TauE/SafE
MTAWLTGILLGVAGSGHCALMCGPLVLTVARTLRQPSRAARARQAVVYHGGRLLSYLLLAVPIGLVSQSASLHGFGRIVSVAAGLGLIGWVMRPSGGRPGAGLSARVGAAAARACVAANRWQQNHQQLGTLGAGAANGLLPCGLVYAAATVAAAMGTARGAVAVMLGFGIGTMPVLLMLMLSAWAMPPGLRGGLRRLTPIAVVVVAVLLILRGLASSPGHEHHHHAAVAVAQK